MPDLVPVAQWGYRVHQWGSEPIWEEFPVSGPGDSEVLIEVEACGIGLTVLNSIDNGEPEAGLPRVPGHEIVGRVVRTGDGVEPGLVGRRVIAYFYLSCHDCAECRKGREPLCTNSSGNVGIHIDGGYAPNVVLPARNTIVIEEELDPVSATVAPDAVATPVHVTARADIGSGDRVVVIGAGGGVGIHMVQVARLRGAEVAGFDVNAEKLRAIESVGAKAIDSSDFSMLRAPFGSSAPSVVVDLIGSAESADWAVASLGRRGRLVVLTTPRDMKVPVEYRSVVLGEISLLGSRYASKQEVGVAVQFVANGTVRPMIGEVTGPDGVLELHRRIRSRELVGRGALDWRAGQ